MKMQIELGSGRVLDVDLNLDRPTWNKVFRHALQRHTLLEVEELNGRIVAINPLQIQFVRYLTGVRDAAEPLDGEEIVREAEKVLHGTVNDGANGSGSHSVNGTSDNGRSDNGHTRAERPTSPSTRRRSQA